MTNNSLPRARIVRLMKAYGATRVSHGATDAIIVQMLADLENKTKQWSANAAHAGRKTITESDIALTV